MISNSLLINVTSSKQATPVYKNSSQTRSLDFRKIKSGAINSLLWPLKIIYWYSIDYRKQ